MVRRIVPILLMVFVFSSHSWAADTIKLKSGKSVQGKIVERDSRMILIDVGLDVPITYYLDEISEVLEDSSVKAQSPSPSKGPVVNPDKARADTIEQQGLAAVEQGDTQGGLIFLREALRLDPQASRYLNLGMILFGNAVSLQKQGKSDEAIAIFREAEKEIQQALKLFDPKGETTFISQAYNLLGEMYANAFNDKSKAQSFYEKSLSFFDNPAARRGLQSLR
jgi:tetratricopeptide (TPR) repeat protein